MQVNSDPSLRSEPEVNRCCCVAQNGFYDGRLMSIDGLRTVVDDEQKDGSTVVEVESTLWLSTKDVVLQWFVGSGCSAQENTQTGVDGLPDYCHFVGTGKIIGNKMLRRHACHSLSH